ncbi:MAG TPA: hypothetical protein VHA11_11090, partial [Bryobacteraceae bacterium]|nr:hypothetical protein [Bryobacteraceae bacterium]
QPDKQVAAYLGKIQLTEKLDGSTMEELQALGVGPRTAEALNALREASKALPEAAKAPAPPPPPPPIPPPSAEEQQKVLNQAREYALKYTKTLPDFLCTQVTRRFVDPGGVSFWSPQDVITARVAYVDHHEDYKLVMVNNRMMASDSANMHSLGGATSTGEFGSLMAEVFEPASDADFGWERWATLRGRRAYVFRYRVIQSRSKWHVTYEKSDDIVPAYHGLVFVDRDTRSVMRVTMDAELPPSFPIQQAYTVLDYDYADISGHPYILPLKAVIRMRQGRLQTKNEVEFRLYRKFTAEASITFDYDTPEPLPEEKTEEQPAVK